MQQYYISFNNTTYIQYLCNLDMESTEVVRMPEDIPQPTYITPKTIPQPQAELVIDEFQAWLINRRNKLQKEMNGYMRKHGHLRELHIIGRQNLRKELRMLHDIKRKYGLEA